MSTVLPETGYLRLSQIIGQKAVTPEEAAANKKSANSVRSEFPPKETITKTQEKELAKKLAKIGPRNSTPPIPAIIPWSKSKLWNAVKHDEFPAPVKLSSRTTAWTVQSIRDFCQRAAE